MTVGTPAAVDATWRSPADAWDLHPTGLILGGYNHDTRNPELLEHVVPPVDADFAVGPVPSTMSDRRTWTNHPPLHSSRNAAARDVLDSRVL